MKNLIIGIWHGKNPEVQSHKTDLSVGAQDACAMVTRHAERQDVPDQILLIRDQRGPFVLYDWTKDDEFNQKDFDVPPVFTDDEMYEADEASAA